MTLGLLIWGITCLIAAVGTVLVFRSEDRHTIADQRRLLHELKKRLQLEIALSQDLRSRLSALQPIDDDEILRRFTTHERARSQDVYDQTKDRGPTRRVPLRWE